VTVSALRGCRLALAAGLLLAFLLLSIPSGLRAVLVVATLIGRRALGSANRETTAVSSNPAMA
jgi:hypothetical protein